MATIEKEFVEVFKELESGHLELRRKLNSLTDKGSALEERLTREIEEFEPWRFKLMDKLGGMTARFQKNEDEAHRRYIRESNYFEAVQEAPFYWRIINKPNGYAGDAQMMTFIYRN